MIQQLTLEIYPTAFTLLKALSLVHISLFMYEDEFKCNVKLHVQKLHVQVLYSSEKHSLQFYENIEIILRKDSCLLNRGRQCNAYTLLIQ